MFSIILPPDMVFLGISIFAHISFRAVSVYMPAHCLSNEQKATRKMRVVLMHRPHAPFIFLVRRCQCPASAPPPFAVRGQLPIALALCIPFDFKMKRDIRSDVSFCGGDKRDRTADLLNAIQALSQLSYTPTGKVYLIRKQHECQERFFVSAKKICAAVLPPAQTGFFVCCAHASQSLRMIPAMAAASFLWPSGSRCSPSSALICVSVPASRKRRP